MKKVFKFLKSHIWIFIVLYPIIAFKLLYYVTGLGYKCGYCSENILPYTLTKIIEITFGLYFVLLFYFIMRKTKIKKELSQKISLVLLTIVLVSQVAYSSYWILDYNHKVQNIDSVIQQARNNHTCSNDKKMIFGVKSHIYNIEWNEHGLHIKVFIDNYRNVKPTDIKYEVEGSNINLLYKEQYFENDTCLSFDTAKMGFYIKNITKQPYDISFKQFNESEIIKEDHVKYNGKYYCSIKCIMDKIKRFVLR